MAIHDVSQELRDPHSGKWSKGGQVLKRLEREATAGQKERHKSGDRVVYTDKRGKEHPATVKRAYTVPRSPEPRQYTIKLDKPTGRYQETTRDVPHTALKRVEGKSSTGSAAKPGFNPRQATRLELARARNDGTISPGEYAQEILRRGAPGQLVPKKRGLRLWQRQS